MATRTEDLIEHALTIIVDNLNDFTVFVKNLIPIFLLSMVGYHNSYKLIIIMY